MTVPDVRHVVIGIEIALTVRVVYPDALAAHEVQRRVVEQRRAASEDAIAPLEQ
jgi:hypothetical protein